MVFHLESAASHFRGLGWDPVRVRERIAGVERGGQAEVQPSVKYSLKLQKTSLRILLELQDQKL